MLVKKAVEVIPNRTVHLCKLDQNVRARDGQSFDRLDNGNDYYVMPIHPLSAWVVPESSSSKQLASKVVIYMQTQIKS